jgi:hypothetical protein
VLVYALFLAIQRIQNGWFFFPEHISYLHFNLVGFFDTNWLMCKQFFFHKSNFIVGLASFVYLVFKSIIVNDGEGKKYNVKVETGGSQLEDDLKSLQKNKTPIFLVTSSKNESWHVDKDGVEIIQPSNEVVILLPGNNQKWEIKDPKDFSLNVEFSILNGKKLSTSLISLGSIVKNIGNIASKAQLVNDKAATPKEIAGILGYKIPDNYAPKQGVKFEDKP